MEPELSAGLPSNIGLPVVDIGLTDLAGLKDLRLDLEPARGCLWCGGRDSGPFLGGGWGDSR